MNRPDIAAFVLAGNAILALFVSRLAGLLARHAGYEINRHLCVVRNWTLAIAMAFAAGAIIVKVAL